MPTRQPCVRSAFSRVPVLLISRRRNKAVADGAILFYLDRRVSVPVAKRTYGVKCNTKFDTSNPEHLLRENTKYIGPSGHQYIQNKFTTILAEVRYSVVIYANPLLITFLGQLQGTRVSEDKEFRRNYTRSHWDVDDCDAVTVDVTSYHGNLREPKWTDEEPGRSLHCLWKVMTLTFETRYVRDALHCGSRYITDDQRRGASQWPRSE